MTSRTKLILLLPVASLLAACSEPKAPGASLVDVAQAADGRVLRVYQKADLDQAAAVLEEGVVTPGTLEESFDRLERAGLVSREKSSKDKRVVNVRLTDEGRSKLEIAPEPLQAEFLRKYRKLADWEQQMLKSSLLRIAAMMDAEDLDAAPILQTGAIVDTQTSD